MECKIKNITYTSALFLLSSMACTVNSAGIQVNEHSATGLGRAYAGDAAIVDTALVVTKNPAAMAQFDRTAVSGQLAFIAPDLNLDYEYKSGIPSKTKTGTESDYAPAQFVPSFATIMPVNEKWAVGFAMFSNFGTGTEVSDEFALGDIGGTTKVITIDNSFNIAYKVNDLLSIGAGYDLIVGQAEMDKAFNLLGKQAFDMSGNAIGHGWNVGTLLSINENNRLALTYRSAVDMDFEGDFFGTGLVFKPNTPSKMTTGEVNFTLPAIAEFSGYHKLTEQFAVHYSATWTQWSVLEELKAVSADCSFMGNSGVCFQKDLDYSNSMRYAIGTTAYISRDVTLRMGYAYDQQGGEPVVVMPDANRHQVSVGVSIAASDALSFDFGASYLMGDEVTFTEESVLGSDTSFTSNGTAWIGSMQMNYIF